jgi:hypothetical protein
MTRIEERIRRCLGVGGLFNPELMEHEKVRDLLIDCMDEVASREKLLERAMSYLDGSYMSSMQQIKDLYDEYQELKNG